MTTGTLDREAEHTTDLNWQAFDAARGLHPRTPSGASGGGAGGALAPGAQNVTLTKQQQNQIKKIQKAAGLPQTGKLDQATVAYAKEHFNTTPKSGGGSSGGSKSKSSSSSSTKTKQQSAKQKAAAAKKKAEAQIAKQAAQQKRERAEIQRGVARELRALRRGGSSSELKHARNNMPGSKSRHSGPTAPRPSGRGGKALPVRNMPRAKSRGRGIPVSSGRGGKTLVTSTGQTVQLANGWAKFDAARRAGHWGSDEDHGWLGSKADPAIRVRSQRSKAASEWDDSERVVPYHAGSHGHETTWGKLKGMSPTDVKKFVQSGTNLSVTAGGGGGGVYGGGTVDLAFNGHKAAPFVKGGGRKKNHPNDAKGRPKSKPSPHGRADKIAAAKQLRANLAKSSNTNLAVPHWHHGWIPANAAADKIKEGAVVRPKGGKDLGKIVSVKKRDRGAFAGTHDIKVRWANGKVSTHNSIQLDVATKGSTDLSVIDNAITPGGRVGDASPLGKPGSKRKLSDYEREVAHALMRKRGIPKARAIPMARGIINNWARGSTGGGRGRPSAAVIAGANASIAQRKSFSNEVPKVQLVDLAAKWKHGYIPLNAEAVAIKEHKKRGSGPESGAKEVVAGGDRKLKGKTSAPKVKAVTKTASVKKATAAPKADHTKYVADKKSMSDRALKEHSAAHVAAIGRARTDASKTKHKREAESARYELARRERAKNRTVVHPGAEGKVVPPERHQTIGGPGSGDAAFLASSRAKAASEKARRTGTAADHARAAKLNDAAAKLHKGKGGSKQLAAQHEQIAANHKDYANGNKQSEKFVNPANGGNRVASEREEREAAKQDAENARIKKKGVKATADKQGTTVPHVSGSERGLTHKELVREINEAKANNDQRRMAVLRVEVHRRNVEAAKISAHAQKAKELVETDWDAAKGDPSRRKRFFAKLISRAPFLKPHIARIQRTPAALAKIKSKKGFKNFIDAVRDEYPRILLNKFGGAALTAGAVAIAPHLAMLFGAG